MSVTRLERTSSMVRLESPIATPASGWLSRLESRLQTECVATGARHRQGVLATRLCTALHCTLVWVSVSTSGCTQWEARPSYM